jgi:predicted RNA binding protein YcfA (HicA-like mRNA interferase family)
MSTQKFFKLIRKQGGIVDARNGKGSHTQVRYNGGAFTVPVCKDVPRYALKQAEALGLSF